MTPLASVKDGNKLPNLNAKFGSKAHSKEKMATVE